MQRLGPVPTPIQLFGEIVDIGSRAAEHQRRHRRLEFEDSGKRRRSIRPPHDVGLLGDFRCFAFDRGVRRDLDAQWVAQVTADHAVDAGRHGGREQDRLSVGRRLGQDLLDVLGEATLEHFVGLVEDHRPQTGQRQRSTPEVIHRPTRRGDHDVDAIFQGLPLSADRRAAVDRQDTRSELATILRHGLTDLERKLAGGHQHQGDRLLGPTPLGQQLQDREGEGGGLPGSGGRSADDVDARQDGRDGRELDRGRFLVPQKVEGLVQLGPQVEILEAAGFSCWGDVHELRPFGGCCVAGSRTGGVLTRKGSSLGSKPRQSRSRHLKQLARRHACPTCQPVRSERKR